MSSKKIAACLSCGERYDTLEMLCAEFGAELRRVAAEEFGCTVGYLMGVSGFEKGSTVNDAQPECLIFSGFSGEELRDLTAKLRKAGLYVPLKAVCTPTNLGWTLRELVGELAKEHEFMKKRAEAKNEDTTEA